MITISSSDPDLEYHNEYDFFCEVYYKGEPFTGIVQDVETLLEQTEYHDGNAHGEYIVHYKSGKLHTIADFERGEEISSKSYYESGELLEFSDRHESKLWDRTGRLAYEWNLEEDVRKQYFKNGELKSISKDKTANYYTRDGLLAMVFPPDEYVDGHYERNIDYKDEVLLQHYADLLSKDFPELEKLNQSYYSQANHIRHLIWMWFWKIFDKDERLYFSIVNNLMKHPDEDVVSSIAGIIAIHRFEPYIGNEDSENTACHTLIREYREHQDKNFPDRDCKKVTFLN